MSLLPSCSPYWQVLTFQSDPASGVEGSYSAVLLAGGPLEGPEGRDKRASDACWPQPTGPSSFAAPLAGIVAGAVIGIAFDLAQDALASQVASLEKRSQTTNALSLSIPDFLFGATPRRTSCLYIERADDTGRVVWHVTAHATPFGASGFRWVPGPMRMDKAAALTGRGEPVTVDIAIATTAIVPGERRPALALLGESQFRARIRPNGEVVPGSGLRASGALPLPANPQAAERTAALTPPGMRAPVVLTLAITETGSAHGSFAGAMKSAEDNLEALRGYLTDYASTFAGQGRLQRRRD